MQYKIITNPKVVQVEIQVNEHLALGWKLHGDPFMQLNQVYQAMVKGEPARPSRVKEREKKTVKKDV